MDVPIAGRGRPEARRTSSGKTRPRFTRWSALPVALLALAACTGRPSPGVGPAGGVPVTEAGDTRVWSDEFDGSALDPSKWAALSYSTYGDGNAELACLTDRPANLQVAGGDLLITARSEAPPLRCGDADRRFPAGRAYSSAMITTKGIAAWAGGRFEMRAQLPLAPATSQGLWPAFWMRPVSGGAQLGEIDVVEGIGGTSANAQAGLHSACHAGETPGSQIVTGRAGLDDADAAAAFHVYSAYWDRDTVRFAIDGTPTLSCTRANAPWLAKRMSGPFYLRVNLAVGGSYPGGPDSATSLPATMRVDWVRVYR